MRISATGTRRARWHRAHEAGFSLIELMVVLFIMALMTGVVMWTLPGGSTEARKEIERFAQQMQLAADQSAISGVPVGVRLNSQGYSFYRYQAGAWQAFDARSALGAEDWPQDVVYLGLRGKSTTPDPEGPADEETEEDQMPAPPQIRFDAIGHATPFGIELENRDYLFTVSGDRQGRFSTSQGES